MSSRANTYRAFGYPATGHPFALGRRDDGEAGDEVVLGRLARRVNLTRVSRGARSSRPARSAAHENGPARRPRGSTRSTSKSPFFKRTPKEIALSLKRSAERSQRRKSAPFRSAMSMLSFYVNRAGRNLPASRRRAIARAKDELRKLYGR